MRVSLGFFDPLPTIARRVSGKRSIKSTRKTPEEMARNQKTDLQPREPARAPPMIGPAATCKVSAKIIVHIS